MRLTPLQVSPASLLTTRRRQPWTTYSVLQTTVTAWALPYDALIFLSWYRASCDWPSQQRIALFVALTSWTFLFSKTVKLWRHLSRHPADLVFIPVYILFGYFHGLIKLYGLLTLNAVRITISTSTITFVLLVP